jgi:hypothetical protein
VGSHILLRLEHPEYYAALSPTPGTVFNRLFELQLLEQLGSGGFG